jgi:hypothetical protein
MTGALSNLSLYILPSEGYSLIDTFYMEADHWSQGLLYTFSFLEQSSGNYIPLNEGTDSYFSTTLPAGNAPSYNLTIRVKVVNSVGDIGTYEQNITVKPYIEKGLLSNKTNEMVKTSNSLKNLVISTKISPGSSIETLVTPSFSGGTGS